MFVFPAFNNNYKKRKRAFLICLLCRDRRIKCEYGEHYLETGCDFCKESKVSCSLIDTNLSKKKPAKKSRANPVKKQVQKPPEDLSLLSNDIAPTPTDFVALTADPIIVPESEQVRDQTPERPEYRNTDPPIVQPLNLMPDIIANPSRKYRLRESTTPVSLAYIRNKYNFILCLRHDDPETANIFIDSQHFELLESINAFSVSDYVFLVSELREFVKAFVMKPNRIFPLLVEPQLMSDYDDSNCPTIVEFCNVLLVLKDKSCEGLMKRALGSEDFDAKLLRFVDQLEFKIRQLLLILAPVEKNTYTRMLVHALLSLTCTSHLVSSQTAWNDISTAVNCAIEMGLNTEEPPNLEPTLSEYRREVMWTLYVLATRHQVDYQLCNISFSSVLKFDSIVTPLPKNKYLLEQVEDCRRFEDLLTPRPNTSSLHLLIANECAICSRDMNDTELYSDQVDLEFQGSQAVKERFISAHVHLLSRVSTNCLIISHLERIQPGKSPEKIKHAKYILHFLSRINESWQLQIPWIAKSLKLVFTILLENSDDLDILKYKPLLEMYARKWPNLSGIKKLVDMILEQH